MYKYFLTVFLMTVPTLGLSAPIYVVQETEIRLRSNDGKSSEDSSPTIGSESCTSRSFTSIFYAFGPSYDRVCYNSFAVDLPELEHQATHDLVNIWIGVTYDTVYERGVVGRDPDWDDFASSGQGTIESYLDDLSSDTSGLCTGYGFFEDCLVSRDNDVIETLNYSLSSGGSTFFHHQAYHDERSFDCEERDPVGLVGGGFCVNSFRLTDSGGDGSNLHTSDLEGFLANPLTLRTENRSQLLAHAQNDGDNDFYYRQLLETEFTVRVALAYADKPLPPEMEDNDLSAVPLPSGVILFGSGMLGFALLRRSRR